MINLTCIPAQHGTFKNKKDIFKYFESKKDFYNMNFVSPDNGRLFNKEDLKKMNVEYLNVRYDDNKKLAVIDVKKNKLV